MVWRLRLQCSSTTGFSDAWVKFWQEEKKICSSLIRSDRMLLLLEGIQTLIFQNSEYHFNHGGKRITRRIMKGGEKTEWVFFFPNKIIIILSILGFKKSRYTVYFGFSMVYALCIYKWTWSSSNYIKTWNVIYLASFVFLGLHPWHMEVPRLGVEWDLQPLTYTTATARWDPSHICDLHHSSYNAGSLTHWARPGNQICIFMGTGLVC